MVWLICAVLIGYCVGSIPSAIIAGRILLKKDIRSMGSGNAGATNVFRVLGAGPALVVVLADIGKGIFSALVVSRLAIGHLSADASAGWLAQADLARILTGGAAIAGHVWTIFAGFRGGKGVATAFGVLVGLAPVAALVSGLAWLAVVVSTRLVSLASLVVAGLFPITLILMKFVFDKPVSIPVLILAFAAGALITVTHRSNIARLCRGKENRMTWKKGTQTKHG